MRFLRILGWVFIPYIMLFVRWKNTGKIAKVIGGAWAALIILLLLTPSPDVEEANAPVESVEEVVAEAEVADQAEIEAEVPAEVEADKTHQEAVANFEQQVR